MTLDAIGQPVTNAWLMSASQPTPACWRNMFGRGLAFWQMNLFFWGLYGLMALGLRLSLGQSPGQAVVFTMVFEGSCLLLSLVLRFFFRRASKVFGLVPAVLLIVLSFGAAVVQGAVASSFTVWIGWQNPVPDFFATTTARMLIIWATFMAWSLGYYWLWAESERSMESGLREEAQRETQRMELQMLRAQLDPHFLFNSLNAIAAEIPTHPAAATGMLNELSEYLRYSLEHRKDVLVALSAEIRSMEAYLRIQHARFGERLCFSVDVEPDAALCLIPCFILQPLVENAIKYGLGNDGVELLSVRLTVRHNGDVLEIRVGNTGAICKIGNKSPGFGLEMVRRRLEIHYPERHALRLIEIHGEVVAELDLKGDACSV